MNAEYYIVVSSDKLASSSVCLTYQLIIDPVVVGMSIENLYSKNIWVVVNKQGALLLWCKLHVGAIEELTTDEVVTGYLITADVDQSEYYSRLDNENSLYRVDKLRAHLVQEEQTLLLIDEQIRAIFDAVTSESPIRFLPPNIDEEVIAVLSKDTANKALWIRRAIRELKKRYVLEELYRYSKYPLKWTPFQCFAVSYLSNLLSIGESELSSFNNGINELLADEALEDTQRHVNLDFKRIDPESVVTRRMIRSSQTPSSELWLQAFEKTDRAVKMHQEMLKNIAIYMCQSLGTSVLESLSIDMFVPGSRTNLVIELKSSTFENFYTQVVNGAIQLKEYCFELERESCQNNQAILIIQDTASSSMKSYCKEFLNYLDIQLLFYDSASDWPNRVVGLEEAVYAIRPKQSTWA